MSVPVPAGTKGRGCDVAISRDKLRVGLKGQPAVLGEPVLAGVFSALPEVDVICYRRLTPVVCFASGGASCLVCWCEARQRCAHQPGLPAMLPATRRWSPVCGGQARRLPVEPGGWAAAGGHAAKS